MLNNLSFAQFKAYYRVEDPIRLPQYTGTLLHDALGRSFWKTRFGVREECPDCPIRSECRYQNLRAYFFKSPADHPYIVANHEALHRMMKRDEYPQPFVFHPMVGGEYQAGDFLVFTFTLLGQAIECFPYMACTLSFLSGRELGLGARRISLAAIVNEVSDGTEELVYEAETGRLMGPCEVLDLDVVRQWVLEGGGENGGVRKLRLNFLTPFRFKSGGKLGVPLTFEVFMRNLLRRLTLLSVHSPFSFDLDYNNLLALAAGVSEWSSSLRWGRLKRHSFSQKESMRLDGYLGEITFTGDLEPFLPYLIMGEFLNVGKAASFGHGKYELTILSD